MSNEVKQIKNDEINFDQMDRKSYVKYIESLLDKYEDLDSNIEYCHNAISNLNDECGIHYYNEEAERFFYYQTEIIENIKEAINHSTMSKFIEYVRYGL